MEKSRNTASERTIRNILAGQYGSASFSSGLTIMHACSSNILFEKHDDEHNALSRRLQHCIEMAFDVWSTIKHLHQNVCTEKRNVSSISHVVHGKYSVGFTIHCGRNNFNQLWRIQCNSAFNHPVNWYNQPFFLPRKKVFFFLNQQSIRLQTDWLEILFHCIRSIECVFWRPMSV